MERQHGDGTLEMCIRDRGRPCRHRIACFCKNVDNIQKPCFDLSLSRLRIINKKQLFHIFHCRFLLIKSVCLGAHPRRARLPSGNIVPSCECASAFFYSIGKELSYRIKKQGDARSAVPHCIRYALCTLPHRFCLRARTCKIIFHIDKRFVLIRTVRDHRHAFSGRKRLSLIHISIFPFTLRTDQLFSSVPIYIFSTVPAPRKAVT